MKLNNKGYLVIEIVLATVIAFGIAYFLFDLTINMKNKNDNLQAKTIIMTDRATIENYIMRTLKESTNITCYSSQWLQFKNDNKTRYIGLKDGSFIDYRGGNTEYIYSRKFNDYETVSGFNCNNTGTSVVISMNIKEKLTQDDYSINLEYVY